MPGPFSLDYLVFVFIAALGVFQIVAAYSNFRGLLLIRPRALAFLFGTAAIALAFLWFFLSEPRNISDAEGGLDGNQMAGLFAVGAGSALVFTFLLSSISNRSLRRSDHQRDAGLDALRETTYLEALRGTLKDLWTRYRG